MSEDYQPKFHCDVFYTRYADGWQETLDEDRQELPGANLQITYSMEFVAYLRCRVQVSTCLHDVARKSSAQPRLYNKRWCSPISDRKTTRFPHMYRGSLHLSLARSLCIPLSE